MPNIIQQQDNLKQLPDMALQKELLNPTGAAPSYLVLTELQRRKDMRTAYAAQQKKPNTSMADEFAQGLGGAQVGQYGNAVRGAMPQQPPAQMPQAAGPDMGMQGGSSPMEGESPEQTQGFAAGGGVNSDFAGMIGLKGGVPSQKTPGGLGALNAVANSFGQPNTAADSVMPPRLGMASLGGGMNPGLVASAPPGFFMDGSAGGATGSGGDAAGGVSGTGGVGGSATDGSGGSAAAGTSGDADGDGSGTYSRGGRVGRYADGGEVMRSKQRDFLSQYLPQLPISPSLEYINKIKAYQNQDLSGLSQDYGPARSTPFEYPMTRKQASEMDNASRIELENPDYQPPDQRGERRMPSLTTDIGTPPAVNPLSFLPARSPYPDGAPQGLPAAAQSPYGEPDEATGNPNNTGAPASMPGGVPRTGGPGPMAGAPNGSPAGGGGAGAPAGGGGRAGGRGGVAGALNIGGEGLAQYIDEIRALQMPDRFGDIEKRNQEDMDKIKGGMEGERGLALLTAGLGIAGGDSPFAAVNIGRGAMAGVKQWNDASKEMRLAERDLRNAQNQITIARANRDEKQLESGMKLYATAQEKQQQALNRANSAGIASADRASRLELANRELESRDKDRTLQREQTEISSYGTLAERYERDATAAQRAYATQSALLNDPTKTVGMSPTERAEALAELEKTKAQAERLTSTADSYRTRYESTLNLATARRQGIPMAGPKEGETADGRKLKDGERFITRSGKFGIWREK